MELTLDCVKLQTLALMKCDFQKVSFLDFLDCFLHSKQPVKDVLLKLSLFLQSRNQDIVSYTSETEERSCTSSRKARKQDSVVLTLRNLCAKVASCLVDKAALKVRCFK
jgi:hypothetical protein